MIFHQLRQPSKNYARGEAELGFGKERKKKKRLFGGIMDDAIDQHFKEEEQKRLKDELRSIFFALWVYRSMGTSPSNHCPC